MKTESRTLEDTNVSLRKAAIITALGLLIMGIIAPIVHMSIFPSLIVQEDPQMTVSNIMSSMGLFRLGIFFFILVAILDIIVAWGLYILLKPADKNISLLAAWFRITYSVLLIVSLNSLLNIVQLLNGANYLKAFEAEELAAKVIMSFNSYLSNWELGLIIFSFHLLVLGFLMLKAKYINNIIAILIVIAGFGYLIDGLGKLLSPSFNYQIALFTFIGEVVLIFWLFWKGIKGFNNIETKMD